MLCYSSPADCCYLLQLNVSRFIHDRLGQLIITQFTTLSVSCGVVGRMKHLMLITICLYMHLYYTTKQRHEAQSNGIHRHFSAAWNLILMIFYHIFRQLIIFLHPLMEGIHNVVPYLLHSVSFISVENLFGRVFKNSFISLMLRPWINISTLSRLLISDNCRILSQ